MKIRDATEADLKQMLDIYNEIIANTTAVFQYDLHTLEMRKEWFAQKQKDGFPVFVADENGKCWDSVPLGLSGTGRHINFRWRILCM